MTSEVADKPRCHCGSTKSPYGPALFSCDTCEQDTNHCKCKLGATDSEKRKAAGLK